MLLIRDRRDARLVAWSLVGLALWQGAIGVHQYATGTGASYMGEEIRAVGTFGASDVMGMATVVSFGVVCSLGLALGAGTGPTAGRWRLGCALALLLPLALSFSRGAWIATAVTLRGPAAAGRDAAGGEGVRGGGGRVGDSGGRARGGHGDAPGADQQHQQATS